MESLSLIPHSTPLSLCAQAAYLQKGGLRTAVLERRHVLGGAAVTEELFPGTAVVCLDTELHFDSNQIGFSCFEQLYKFANCAAKFEKQQAGLWKVCIFSPK